MKYAVKNAVGNFIRFGHGCVAQESDLVGASKFATIPDLLSAAFYAGAAIGQNAFNLRTGSAWRIVELNEIAQPQWTEGRTL